MEHIYDTLIIGGGPAGYSAALYTSRAGLDTAVIEKMGAGGQMMLTDVIDNYPGFDSGIEGFELSMKMQAGAERFGTQTLFGNVISVDFSKKIKRVITDNEEIHAKTVIIATGANPRELGIDKEKELTGKGVHYCAHCDGRFYKDKTVAVVGGGNSAVSDALYLSHLAKDVILIHRRNTLRATKIYHEPLMNASNVRFVWDSQVIKLNAENSFKGVTVQNIKTSDKTDIECDALFVSIGRTPVTEFLAGEVELDKYGYIVADETTQTNVSGVFAAGDVRTKALRQVITAASDGATAAHFAEEYLSQNK